jgi:shikimate dehydrogenase
MIGTPLDHVETPRLLNPVFRNGGHRLEVVRVEVAESGLAEFVQAARADHMLAGLVVTTPLKRAIRAHLDRESPIVALTGAANCVRADEGVWTGVNFDGYGFAEALAALPNARAVRSALIVGCGGAGSAIAASLVAGPVASLSLCDADLQKALDLRSQLARFTPLATVTCVAEPAGRFDLIVNASPLGLAPGDPSPIPAATVAAAEIVADIVTVEATALKQLAAGHRKPLLTGRAMVEGQIPLMRRFFTTHAGHEADVLREPQETREGTGARER